MIWHVGIWGAAVALFATYLYGQRRIAGVAPGLARRARLICFGVAAAAWAASLAFPLALLSQQHVLARMAQIVLTCMVAAPLFWLAAPWHVLAWAAPTSTRKWLSATFVRPARVTPLLRTLNSALFVWFFYLSTVLIWHDPGFVSWAMVSPWRQRLALLIVGTAALLFWQQITRNGPRRYTKAAPLARVGMLLGVEIPNVVVGITIAFGTSPLYAYYAALPGIAPSALQAAFSQQALSGALTWIFGSLVYITSVVLVVNELFAAEGFRREPPVNWDSEQRLIAPGLEERLNEYGRPRHDWDE